MRHVPGIARSGGKAHWQIFDKALTPHFDDIARNATVEQSRNIVERPSGDADVAPARIDLNCCW